MIVWLTLAGASVAWSQPFGTPARFLGLNGGDAYVQVPSAALLNPSSQITIEFWMQAPLADSGCYDLVGKGYLTSYWIGFCNHTLRTILRGGLADYRDGGTIPDSSGFTFYHHIAVTFDGVRRKHYIDGELVGVFPETAPLPANNQPLRFGGDVDFPGHTPGTSLFEVRLWRVARTQAQIRQTIAQEINAPTPGLVAVWHLRGNAVDVIGGHDGGAPQGNAGFFALHPSDCDSEDNLACWLGNRFDAQVEYQVLSAPALDGHRTLTSNGLGTVVPGASENSANFWFFDPSNWELLIKVINGCAIDNHYWVYAAAPTDQHYEIMVTDEGTATRKVYFNYAGAPAPALTDSAAFATCP
jgi:hypothetical protein